MRYILLFLLCVVAPVAFAHQPAVVAPTSVGDVVSIENHEISQAFYGELNGFVHTYEITATEPFTLYAQILEPDNKDAENIHGGIIIRERDNGRGVETIVRMPASSASWESFYEPFGGDRYLRGPEFEQEVGPGVYRIEVNTPENTGKYVLSVGKIEDFSDVGYFETIAKIYEVKRFLGKSPFAILGTPFVYVPLTILLLLLLVFRMYWKKKHG